MVKFVRQVGNKNKFPPNIKSARKNLLRSHGSEVLRKRNDHKSCYVGKQKHQWSAEHLYSLKQRQLPDVKQTTHQWMLKISNPNPLTVSEHVL